MWWHKSLNYGYSLMDPLTGYILALHVSAPGNGGKFWQAWIPLRNAFGVHELGPGYWTYQPAMEQASHNYWL